MIKARFFAQLAEDAGCDTLELEFKAGVTARKLLDELEPRIAAPGIDTLRHDVVLLSINQVMAEWDAELSDGDEVGFLPPFSGG
ncbi:MAG: MoaD/ThiS family protein [Gammaproteobacteria bacterium]|nr:MoaD/ThiS family protein [Gammaproteobacteria bacterium]